MRDPVVLPSRLLLSIEEADARFPTERKLLVGRDRSEGRELLRALALRKGGWMGWEAATVRDLAGELALTGLADRGLRPIDDVEQAALAGLALDRVVEERRGSSVFAGLADGVGFRAAIAGSIEALRLAGIAPRRIRSAAGGDRKLDELASVLESYEAELERRQAADSASVMVLALAAFEVELPLLAARLFLIPWLSTRGLSGRLVARLVEAGTGSLAVDLVHGLEVPPGLLISPRSWPATNGGARRSPLRPGQLELAFGPSEDRTTAVERGDATFLSWLHAPDRVPRDTAPLELRLFRASSPASELREILRRLIARGIAWDQVEIVASDPVTYGGALDVLSSALAIEVTYAVGLPVERSRVGRVLQIYLSWLEGGLHARAIWEAVASGDLRPPDVEGERASRSGVVRELRRLRIGWGRARYVAARARIGVELAAARALPEEAETADQRVEEAQRVEWRRRDLRSLDRLLEKLLASLPPGLGEVSGPPAAELRISASDLAAGALRFLELFRARGEAEKEALRRVHERLSRVALVSTRPAAVSSALAELRHHLTIRVPSPRTLGRLPWSSAAGKLHLTDIAHGGRTGRPFTFVVGLDAERTSPGRVQDPILLDADRRVLGEADLPTTADRILEGQYALATLLAGLRGEVTLSYAGWDAADGSVLSPSPTLLQALRARERDPARGFQAEDGGPPGLDETLGAPVSPVPSGEAAADATDVLLRALSEGPLLLEGTSLVRGAFPMLDRGLAGREARGGAALTSFQGRIEGAGRLDPRDRADSVISATSLEKLAACPLSWFYRFGLRLKKPDDPVYDPGRWLDNLERGTLLHRIFERFGKLYLSRQAELGLPAARDAILAITEEELERQLREAPPPNAAALAADRDEIIRSALVFYEMERAPEDARWEAFELAFGWEAAPPVEIPLPGGRTLRLHGRIDRVDRLPGGGLRVVDYKTGQARYYEKRAGDSPFSGGRRIQAGIYARVVEALRSERVDRFEYRFFTSRGEQVPVGYDRDELEAATPIVEGLLDMVQAGLFLATDDPADCGICDYRPVCRVTGRGKDMVSPPAVWSRDHGEALKEYATLRRLRSPR